MVNWLGPALRDQLVHLWSGQGTGVVDLLANVDVLDMPADSEGLLQCPHLALSLGRQHGWEVHQLSHLGRSGVGRSGTDVAHL